MAKRQVTVTIREDLLREAKEHGLNVSHAAEEGIAARTKEAREEKWREENRAGIEGWNDYVRENGLPLEKYRTF